VTLIVPPGLLAAVRAHAESAYPEECCGVLAGDAGDPKHVAALMRVKNGRADSPANRYLIEPDDLRKVDAALTRAGLEIVGYYHSHPDAPARPSEFDRAQAWPWYSYLIVAVAGGRAGEVASWTLAADRTRFDPEPVLGLSVVTTEGSARAD
jgi:proteasome lid subunit RPN8/RPN11